MKVLISFLCRTSKSSKNDTEWIICLWENLLFSRLLMLLMRRNMSVGRGLKKGWFVWRAKQTNGAPGKRSSFQYWIQRFVKKGYVVQSLECDAFWGWENTKRAQSKRTKESTNTASWNSWFWETEVSVITMSSKIPSLELQTWKREHNKTIVKQPRKRFCLCTYRLVSFCFFE